MKKLKSFTYRKLYCIYNIYKYVCNVTLSVDIYIYIYIYIYIIYIIYIYIYIYIYAIVYYAHHSIIVLLYVI